MPVTLPGLGAAGTAVAAGRVARVAVAAATGATVGEIGAAVGATVVGLAASVAFAGAETVATGEAAGTGRVGVALPQAVAPMISAIAIEARPKRNKKSAAWLVLIDYPPTAKARDDSRALRSSACDGDTLASGVDGRDIADQLDWAGAIRIHSPYAP